MSNSNSTVTNDGYGDKLTPLNAEKIETNNASENEEKVISAHSFEEAPAEETDKWKLVYITMIVYGIGTLMPWNMFITAKDYFLKYKLSPEYTNQTDVDYEENFIVYLGLAAQFPSVIFNWVNIFANCDSGGSGNTSKRIIYALLVQAVFFFLTIIMALVDTSGSPTAFYVCTLFTVVVLHCAGAVFQNCIYGIGAKVGYLGALVLGSNVCGVFTSIVSLISLAATPNIKKAAIFYFATALVVIALCLGSYISLPKNRFYNYKSKLKSDKSSSSSINLAKDERSPVIEDKKPPYLTIIKHSWPQLYNIFMVFFVTLIIFPAVHSEVGRVNKDFFISDKYFVGVTCFLTFNGFALIGNIIPEVVQWPKPEMLWIPVTLRLLFIPFYLLCNYQPHDVKRSYAFIFGDWIYLFGSALFGLTSGYCSSLAMIYCPMSVPSEYASLAGMFGVAFLVTGVFLGILFSYAIPYMVGTYVN